MVANKRFLDYALVTGGGRLVGCSVERLSRHDAAVVVDTEHAPGGRLQIGGERYPAELWTSTSGTEYAVATVAWAAYQWHLGVGEIRTPLWRPSQRAASA